MTFRRFPTPTQLAWVERAVGPGARVVGGRRMLGGIASSVHRLSVRTPSRTVQVVLKRLTDPNWEGADTAVVDEAAALATAEQTAAPAPRVLDVSPDGADTGGVPSLLMTRAPGRVWLTPDDLDAWVRQLAALLPQIHAGPPEVRAREQRDGIEFTTPESACRPEVWAAARSLVAGAPPPGEAVFTHGDYQHFNVLWSRGRLSTVVDWAESRVGSPDVDVGHCRLNLAALFSPNVAEEFRRAYESEAGRSVEPWWDVHQLLAFNDRWPSFIPVQVAGRTPVGTRGMTSRVEELLGLALARA